MSKTLTFPTKSCFIPKQIIFFPQRKPQKETQRGRKKSEEKMNPSHSECVKEISHPIFFQNTFFTPKHPQKKNKTETQKRKKVNKHFLFQKKQNFGKLI